MAMHKVKNLAVKIGSYTDRSGKERGRWHNIGSVMEDDNGGKFLLLDRTFNPAGVPNPDNRDSVIVSIFDIRDKDDNDNGNQQDGGSPYSDENVPF